MRGYLTEGRGWLEDALGSPGVQPPLVRAQALAGAGAIAWRQGDLEAADAYASESVALYREVGEEGELVGPLSVIGVVASNQGDHERARIVHEEAADLARKVGDGFGFAISLNNQAYEAWMTGEVDRAEGLWIESVSAAREAQTTEVPGTGDLGLG